MNKDDIKKIAKYSALKTTVDQEVVDFVLNNLSRKELILYLRYLKSYVDRMTVKIVSSGPISATLKKVIEKEFEGKMIVYKENDDVGPGIKVTLGDTTIDLSISGFISSTVEKIKLNYD